MTFKEPIPTFHYHSSIKIPAATVGRKGRKVCLTYKPIGIVWCVLGVWVSSKFSNNAKGNFRRVEEEPSWRSFDMPSSQGFKVNIRSRIAFRFSFLSRRGGEEKRAKQYDQKCTSQPPNIDRSACNSRGRTKSDITLRWLRTKLVSSCASQKQEEGVIICKR